MGKKSSLLPDWREQAETEIAECKIYGPWKSRMIAILPKKELMEAVEAIWDECHRNGKDRGGFLDDIVALLYDATAYTSDDNPEFVHTTRAGYFAIAKTLEIVQKDWCCPPEKRDEAEAIIPLGESISWENMTRLIDWYKDKAEKSTNSKGKSEREYSTLWILMVRCRLLKIKYWVKVVSPLMRSVFGPTWTAAYTKRRAADWKLNEEISEMGVAKDGTTDERWSRTPTRTEVPDSD
ncbi:MAG: hypothetical protein IH577_03575 [Deltaproteobacteria bacterium]|nr:hypothetical protein [Deltaproteobacteria bacterium]